MTRTTHVWKMYQSDLWKPAFLVSATLAAGFHLFSFFQACKLSLWTANEAARFTEDFARDRIIVEDFFFFFFFSFLTLVGVGGGEG